MLAALEDVGNPSSVHAEGRRARAIVEGARELVAALVGSAAHNVIFTSGATEAAAHALTPHWSGGDRMRPCGGLYVSAIEHPCILAGGRFGREQVTVLPVTQSGSLDLAVLSKALAGHDAGTGRPLLALMLANNETGIIQPVAEAAALAREAGSLVVCDAVQAAGRIPIAIGALGVDALLLSAHKLGGPKGAGALVLADDAVAPDRLLGGGGQERRQRAGTENVAAIAGFGAAAAAALAELPRMPAVAALRDRLEQAPYITVIGRGSPRLANTSLLSLIGASAETLVIQLDLAGIAVSAGAACSSGKVSSSHVLTAMGADPSVARGAVRVSLGAATTEVDVERFVETWRMIARRPSRSS
jgi:cysteine desulfurase